MQDGGGTADAASALYRLQTGSLPDDDPLRELRSEAGRLHLYALRASNGHGPGSRPGLLPGSMQLTIQS